MRIVLLEQDICGGGPQRPERGLRPRLVGAAPVPGEAIRAAEAARDRGGRGRGGGRASARGASEHGVDAWLREGRIPARSTPSRTSESGWERSVADVERLGGARAARHVGPGARPGGLRLPGVRRRASACRARHSIQPACLARGLRRVLLERGVVDPREHHVRRRSGSGSGGPGQPSVGLKTDRGSGPRRTRPCSR